MARLSLALMKVEPGRWTTTEGEELPRGVSGSPVVSAAEPGCAGAGVFVSADIGGGLWTREVGVSVAAGQACSVMPSGLFGAGLLRVISIVPDPIAGLCAARIDLIEDDAEQVVIALAQE